MQLYPKPESSVTIFHAYRHGAPRDADDRSFAVKGARSTGRWGGSSVRSRSAPERVLKAARSSYHNEGKKERQVAQLPALKEEIAKKRLALKKGYEWPDEASRRSAGYTEAGC